MIGKRLYHRAFAEKEAEGRKVHTNIRKTREFDRKQENRPLEAKKSQEGNEYANHIAFENFTVNPTSCLPLEDDGRYSSLDHWLTLFTAYL